MRADNRKPDELRPVVINTDFSSYAEGSVLISIGNTKVLCNVSIDENIPRWIEIEGRSGGWITAEYAMLPRSTHKRRPREIYRLGGRTQEIRRLIGRSLRAAVDLNSIGKRTFIIDCDVLQADGGTRTAAITGGYLALYIALKELEKKHILTINPFKNQIAAISVGIVRGVPMLDLSYEEDLIADVDSNIVMNNRSEFIEIQSTAEKESFSYELMEQLLQLAKKGINELIQIQKTIQREFS
ncbi:MAG: ribonuclease PH [Anaerolineales bacterium]|jgi:ribonuclease PH